MRVRGSSFQRPGVAEEKGLGPAMLKLASEAESTAERKEPTVVTTGQDFRYKDFELV